MAISIFYIEVIVNGQSTGKAWPSVVLTDKEAISYAKKKAKEIVLPLDHSQTNNVTLNLHKGDRTNDVAYTVEAVRYPSRRGVEIFVSDNI